MADRQSLEFRGRVSPDAAAAYLESLARGLRDRHIAIEAGNELIESAVGDEVSLELEAEANSKGRFTLSIDFDWRLRREEPAPTMLISSHPSAAPREAVPSDAGSTGYSSE